MNTSNLEHVYRLIAKSGLTRISTELPNSLKYAIRIETTPLLQGSIGVGASKMGGLPDLSPETRWPKWKGIPMAFVAQINLREIAPYDYDHLCPPSGLLSFFHNSEQDTFGDTPQDRGSWEVILTAEGTLARLRRTAYPPDFPEEGQFAECTALFSSEWTIPPKRSPFVKRLQLDEEENRRYYALLASLARDSGEMYHRHRLLGYPMVQLQDDMQTICNEVADRAYSGDQPPGINTVIDEEWVHLLQIDTDEYAHMMWGEYGFISYWMRRGDLAKHSFEQCWLIAQSL